MQRRIKNVKAHIIDFKIERFNGRVLISGDIKEEIYYVEENNTVQYRDDSFGFNHTFPVACLKGSPALKGSIIIEHITSTLIKKGENVAKDYLINAELIVEGWPRKINERFLISNTSKLPPIKRKRKIPLQQKDPVILKNNEEEGQNDWGEAVASREEEMEKRLSALMEVKLQQKINQIKEELIDEQKKRELEKAMEKKARMENKKLRIIAESNRQERSGYSLKGEKDFPFQSKTNNPFPYKGERACKF